MAKTLVLPLKAEYFDAIRAGTKLREFRLCTPYWEKRLQGGQFDTITLTKGYPARDDAARRMVLPYRGYIRQTITHPHFGPFPVQVFAIDVSAATPAPTAPDRQPVMEYVINGSYMSLIRLKNFPDLPDGTYPLYLGNHVRSVPGAATESSAAQNTKP